MEIARGTRHARPPLRAVALFLGVLALLGTAAYVERRAAAVAPYLWSYRAEQAPAFATYLIGLMDRAAALYAPHWASVHAETGMESGWRALLEGRPEHALSVAEGLEHVSDLRLGDREELTILKARAQLAPGRAEAALKAAGERLLLHVRRGEGALFIVIR